MDSYAPFFACLLFSHLLIHSEVAKQIARNICLTEDETVPNPGEEEEDKSSLVSILVGNLMMAQREQTQSANAGAGPERALEWSRIEVGYLIVLSIWLWESPATVKEFLSEGSNLQVVSHPARRITPSYPITHASTLRAAHSTYHSIVGGGFCSTRAVCVPPGDMLRVQPGTWSHHSRNSASHIAEQSRA